MEEKLYSVYRHTSPSGKVYIGITCQPIEHRWNHGRGYMNLTKSMFKSTIIKYGWDNIKHEVLFSGLSEQRAKQLEIDLIRHYKQLGISLNVTDGGDGCYGIIPWNKGIKVPYEKSNKRKGCHLTEEHKKKLSISHKGKPVDTSHLHTKESIEKRRLARLGTHRTEEEKRKISEHSPKSKKVLEFDLQGNVIHTFKSGVEAARFYGISGSGIAWACRKKIFCKGHIFMYADDIVDISEVRYGRYKAGNEIVIENIVTGEINKFHSESSCTRFLGLKSIASLRKAVQKRYYIKNEWKIKSYKGQEVVYGQPNTITKPKPLVCRNTDTGVQLILPSIKECRRFLGLKSATPINKALHHQRSTNIINGWEVSYAA